MIMVQFIDVRSGENMTELGSREWPAVPQIGDELVFTNPAKKCKVVNATWIDLQNRPGKVIARVELEEISSDPV